MLHNTIDIPFSYSIKRIPQTYIFSCVLDAQKMQDYINVYVFLMCIPINLQIIQNLLEFFEQIGLHLIIGFADALFHMKTIFKDRQIAYKLNTIIVIILFCLQMQNLACRIQQLIVSVIYFSTKKEHLLRSKYTILDNASLYAVGAFTKKVGQYFI